MTYCLKCKSNKKNIDANILKTKNCLLNLSSNSAVCDQDED